jgi:hypothetical protein
MKRIQKKQVRNRHFDRVAPERDRPKRRVRKRVNTNNSIRLFLFEDEARRKAMHL